MVAASSETENKLLIIAGFNINKDDPTIYIPDDENEIKYNNLN